MNLWRLQLEGQVHLVSKFANQTYSDVDYNDDAEHYFILVVRDKGLPEDFMRLHAEKGHSYSDE